MRGVAVALVVVHHLKVPGVYGGWLGVDLFFALSGFLITVSVLSMGDRGGLGDFYRRRWWRLGPALAVFLLTYVVWSVGAADARLRFEAAGAAAGQALNVTMAGSRHGVEFSEHIGHLWSLSAEVQFYVLWALLLTWLVRRRASTVVLALTAAALLLCSIGLRTALALDGMQWNRLYFGPDTRAGALFAGCLVGVLYQRGVFGRHAWLRWGAALLVVPAAVVLGVLVGLRDMDLPEPPVYRWGLTVIAFAAGVVVAAAAVRRGGPLRPLLELPPITWLGQVSYSLYLWHLPVIAVVREQEVSTTQLVAISVPISLVLAWVSYVLVERPLFTPATRARLLGRVRG